MAINIMLECGHDADLHCVAIHATDAESGEFEVELLDHDSMEWEDMIAAMGGERSNCAKAHDVLSLGLQKIFEYEDLTKSLLKEIAHHGVEKLGMSQEGFARLVIDYVEFLIPRTGFYTGSNEWYNLGGYSSEIDADEFLKLADAYLPWFRKTRAFKRRVHNMALLAYMQQREDAGYLNFFARLVAMTKGKRLIRVVLGNEDVYEEGSGHVRKWLVLQAYMGRTMVDEWRIAVDGWICDFGMWEWCVERDRNESQSPSDATHQILITVGHHAAHDGMDSPSRARSSVDVIENLVKKHAPEMPAEIRDCWNKDHGPYVILHHPHAEFGRFETLEEASVFFDAHVDASEFVLRQPHAGMCGINLLLVRVVDAPDEPDENTLPPRTGEEDWIERDFNYDTHPGEIWEILNFQEI